MTPKDPRGSAGLERFKVQAPCPLRWEDMQGGDQERDCQPCAHSVVNLSNMSRAAGEALIEERQARGEKVCVYYHLERDGRISTEEGSPRARATRRRRLRLAVATGTTLALGLGATGCGPAPYPPEGRARGKAASSPAATAPLATSAVPAASASPGGGAEGSR